MTARKSGQLLVSQVYTADLELILTTCLAVGGNTVSLASITRPI
mgnify:FL=1